MGRAMNTAMSAAINALARRLGPRLARLREDTSGVSAVEFALLLPVMVTLYLGSVEVSTGIAADRKVALTAHTLADLSSQYTDITNADMSNILNATSAIMAPYSTANLQAVVSELSINAQGQASVVWSDALNGTALTAGQTVSVPAALAVPNSYLILGQVQYNYNPTFGTSVTGPLTLSDQMYVRPRQSTAIARTAS
jgi:Flp pilus assembly protein TadG